MDRQLMKDIQGVIDMAFKGPELSDVFRLMGVSVKLGAGSYNASNGSIKIEIADVIGGINVSGRHLTNIKTFIKKVVEAEREWRSSITNEDDKGGK
jgi:hypothetical protein